MYLFACDMSRIISSKQEDGKISHYGGIRTCVLRLWGRWPNPLRYAAKKHFFLLTPHKGKQILC